jgi:P-type Ca2+ transporter type 2C
MFIGSKTETALLKFTKDLGWGELQVVYNYKDIRDAANIVLMIPFSSECRSMGCVCDSLMESTTCL